VLIVVATAGGGFLGELLKWWFARQRPDIVPHLVEVGSASFPSGHSMLAIVTYVTLLCWLAARYLQYRGRVEPPA
jgi:undecaprenyl-diphosphatase